MIVGDNVLRDIPFQDLFHFNMFDPYRGFRDSGVHCAPATGFSNTIGRRSRGREFIIPIHVEGRDSPVSAPAPSYQHHIDLTDDNTNNSGLHSRARARRRQQVSVSRHNSEAGKSSDSGVSVIPISQSSRDDRTVSSTSNQTNQAELSKEFIDLCMYEDMFNDTPDCYISESFNDTTKSTSKSNLASKSEVTLSAKETSPSASKSACPKSITQTPSYPVYKYLKSELAKDGRLIDYIRGDGNCFFRALSKEIYGSEEFHQEVRQAVVDLIEEYSKEFEQFLDSGMSITEHIKDMRKDTTWASSAEIYAAATLVQRDVYILSPDHTGDSYNWMLFKPRFIYTRDTSYHPCFMTLCHTHGNHYDRITPVHGDCNCDCDPPTLSGIKAYVDLTK